MILFFVANVVVVVVILKLIVDHLSHMGGITLFCFFGHVLKKHFVSKGNVVIFLLLELKKTFKDVDRLFPLQTWIENGI